jgi:hypothetical protein
MKRVRKYIYLPQEEIEVIETKSGQTIKSKEILDGNYVKAKPAPKKAVKKAVKKVVRKKYDDGGIAAKEYFNKGVIDTMVEDFIKKLKMKGINATKRVSKNGVFVYGEKLGSGYKYDTYISYSEIPNKEFLDIEMSEFIRLHKNKKKDYSELPLTELDKRIIRQIERDIEENPNVRYDDELFYMADGGMMAKGGKLVGNQKKLDVNKNGKLDAEDFKMLRGEKMADGGEIEVGDKVKAKYAKYHATVTEIVDDVEVPYAKITYSDGRVKKADLQNLQKVTLAIAPEYVNPDYMAKGGKTPIVRTQFEEEEFEYAEGGMFYGYRAQFYSIDKTGVFDLIESRNFDKKPTDETLKELAKKMNGQWVQLIHNHKVVKEIDLSDGYMADGGMMNEDEAKARKAILRDRLYNVGFEYYSKGLPKKFGKDIQTILIEASNEEQAAQIATSEFGNFGDDFKILRVDKYDQRIRLPKNYGFTEEEAIELKMKNPSLMADGGKVTDKEVAESNVHMLQSNIKSIKHHAEELESAIKDNTEVEGWVLAKADRAATAMSDITHYIDGRKLGSGGMVAGHYYKDKAGSDLRYIGPDSKNDDLGIFKNGEKYLTKSFDDFEKEKEKKSFWFGNGGFMPSGFSRKVSLSEKAEEMVGKNTWHMLDAAQKGEVIGELISDGALALTMDKGGIIDANDWSKSMTQDKIYALKKAGYSENIASEMSLLPYEQLPMWVRQDFKKGSIVIGAYHIHKNDNEVPIDGKVLVLNGDEEVVYSAETLEQAQEWAINQMQEVEDEDDGNYIYVSDCCGAEAGSALDIGICPMCGEHCDWEKESTYADGGVTEATKFKVVYKLKDSAEPKEKLFDNAEKAEFFLETIQEDDDIESANLVEVKPMKKAAEKKAPNLFAAAKPAAASSASKKTKEDVLVPGIADRIARYDALKAIIKNAEAEKEVIGGSLKEVGKEKFLELYELRRRNPDTFNLVDEDEKIMFYVMDKYIKVEPEKAGMLENYPGLLETTTTYKFNPALLDRTGEIISRLIMESTELSDDEKANLIVAETKIGIKTGSIDRLMDYDNPAQIFDLIEPIMALK